MSWLARSLVNSLHLDDEDRYDSDALPSSSSNASNNPPPSSHSSNSESECQREEPHQPRHDHEEPGAKSEGAEFQGIKEEKSEIWAVASFLEPPPTPPVRNQIDHRSLADFSRNDQPSDRSDQSASGDEREEASGASEISWIEDEYGEIRRRLGNDRMESSTMVLDFNSVYSEEGNEELNGSGHWNDAVGVTYEVLAFARNIAMHPETWLDFPLEEEEELDDFNLSVAQRDHVFAVLHHTPTLAALRTELCPCHMTDSYFWKVYFVLLHSRLNKQDADILSTSQAVKARARWMQELQKRTKPEQLSGRSIAHFKDANNTLHEDQFCHGERIPHGTYASARTEYETEKHPVSSTEIPILDKSAIQEEAVICKHMELLAGPSKSSVHNYDEEEGDEWLEDDSDYSVITIPMGNEDDVTFSDLEDDDAITVSKKFNVFSNGYGSSMNGS